MTTPTPRLIIIRHGKCIYCIIPSLSHTLTISQARLNGLLTGPSFPTWCPRVLVALTSSTIRRAVVMFVLTSSLRLPVLISLSYLRISDQTGRTDIPLTEHGREQIKSKASFLVGEGSAFKWICQTLSHIFSQNSLTQPTCTSSLYLPVVVHMILSIS